MKILACCPKGFYAKAGTEAYEYLSFVEVPRRMGHTVHHVDHMTMASEDRAGFNDLLLSVVKNGHYDLLMVVMFRDELEPEMLDLARRYTRTLAWNCDDDWRWESYSSNWVDRFTFMATTSRNTYESQRGRHENLLLSQWGCTGLDPGVHLRKDIDFSFVGTIYGSRVDEGRTLSKKADLQVFGHGRERCLGSGRRVLRRFERLSPRFLARATPIQTQSDVKAVWNRTKISWTPLEASTGGGLQIKGRVFDMGLSGSIMLCSKTPCLDEYYRSGKDYEDYSSLEECVDKVEFYLRNDSARRRMAENYHRRTLTEHLWEYRFTELFKEMGLPA